MPDMSAVAQECGNQVEGNTAAYPCYIPRTKEVPDPQYGGFHEGPCAARELPVTERRRQAWLDQQEAGKQARAVLAQSQGPAQSGTELHGEVDAEGRSIATPVPGSHLQPREHRLAHQPNMGAPGEVKREPTAAEQETWLRQTLATAGYPADQIDTMVDASRGVATASPKSGGHASLPEVMAQPADESLPDVAEAMAPTVATPTKQRAGDQKLPAKDNPRKPVQDTIIEEMEESKRVGTERYGQPLKPLNGRDTFQDLAEEARDFHVYATCLRAERDEILGVFERAYSATVAEAGGNLPTKIMDDFDIVLAWLRGSPKT